MTEQKNTDASAGECRYCEITADDCQDRIEHEDAVVEVETDAFSRHLPRLAGVTSCSMETVR
jgi:hypothetical protein